MIRLHFYFLTEVKKLKYPELIIAFDVQNFSEYYLQRLEFLRIGIYIVYEGGGDLVNSTAFDFTVIVQIISFLIFALFICGIICIPVFIRRKQKQDEEIMEKLDRIIDLLENNKKNF